jgi:hypothetical protein
MLLDPSASKRGHVYSLSELVRFDKKSDLLLLLLTLIPHLLLFISNVHRGQLNVVLRLHGAWHNVLMSDILFGRAIPDASQYFTLHRFSRANVFPLYPLLLVLFRFVLRRPVLSASALQILLSCATTLVFHRLCLATRFVSKPLLTACLFTVVPFRSVLLRQIANEYSLVTLLLSLCLLARRVRARVVLGVSLVLLICSSETGLFAALGILVTSGRSDLKVTLLADTVGILGLMYCHARYARSPFAFVRNIVETGQYPFREMLTDANKIEQLREFHGSYGYFSICVLGAGMLTAIDWSIGLPVLAVVVWASSRMGRVCFDLACPGEAFGVLMGFEALIASQRFETALFVLAPLYGAVVLWVTWMYMNNGPMTNR